MNNTNTYIIVGIGGVIVLGLLGWFFLRTPTGSPSTAPDTSFGIGDDRTVTIPPLSPEAENETINTTQVEQIIFKVADGPVTGATLIQTLHPTTTLARYVLQENGHVLELVLNSPGAIARAVSNTTIPGTLKTLWVDKGAGAVLQYLDGEVVKSVYFGFPASPTTTATTSQSTRPVRIQFFPDNLADIAASPDGKSVAYFLKTATGVDGYTAKSDGTNSKKLFSLPLSEILISWPAPTTLLLQTKSVSGTPGIVFSVNTQTGAVIPLIYAPGLTATADTTFSRVVYQTIVGGRAPTSYVHDVKTGADIGLSFDPIPEKCVWGPLRTTMLYCASPLGYVPANYLDLWHQGAASAVDALFSFDTTTGNSSMIAAPGGNMGGVVSDILEIAVSPDEKYLLFTKKGDRSLWAVRLGSTP